MSVGECKTDKKIVAALLTGMGHDGAQGLLALKNIGALTIAQDEDSSIVFGMPKAAIELNAHTKICSLSDIANVLTKEITDYRHT